MAKWTNFYKIITPGNIDTNVLSDNKDIGAHGSSTSDGWYHQVITGSGNRLMRYREYDSMDLDVDISRALDLIAEEISGNTTKSDEPLLINIKELDNTNSSEAKTINSALKHWIELHDLKRKIYNITRHTIKYGDVFFTKSDPGAPWIFVHPKDVTGAIINSENITDVRGWKVRRGTTNPMSSMVESETIPLHNIVRFSLNDDMSVEAPFGVSILKAIQKTYKQKELLEDAIVIYRIQRAPERRVFYIDTGKMPPNKAKQYLEQVKIEMRQKKVPSHNGSKSEIDSVYNPMSTSEDFFLSQKADGRGSKIETLPGGQGLGEISDVEYFSDKLFRGLKIPLSYMKEGTEGSAFNDGKLGQSYISELRFSLYIERIQTLIEHVLDSEFKSYLRHIGINIDASKFNITLPEPSNFGKYRHQEMQAALLSTYSQADDIDYLSKKYIMSKYLQMSNEDILENERELLKERGINPDDYTEEDIIGIYSPGSIEGVEGDEGSEGMEP